MIKGLALTSLFFLFSFSFAYATSTCEPLQDEFMCSPEIVIGSVSSASACQALCEGIDTTCCYWREASSNCHMGNTIYFEGRRGRYASTCSIDAEEEPLTPPYINIANVFDINTTQASFGGTFLFEDYTDITAYVKLDNEIQTQTLYEEGISQYHSQTITNLTHNTTYSWDFCINYIDGEICNGIDYFTTLPIINETIPVNETDCVNNTEYIYINNTIYVNVTEYIYINQTIDLENYTLVDRSLCAMTDNDITLCLFSTSGNEEFNQEVRDDIAGMP